MKAVAVYPREKRLAVIADFPEPRPPGETEVLVKILEVGVCGTDKEIAQFHYGEPPPGSDRLVLGHEALGQVVSVGSAVHGLKAGDLVVPTVRRPCGDPDCSACAVGRQDYCFTGQFLERGIKGIHGFMTEYIIEDEAYLHPVPHSLRNLGVLVEPLTIGQKALSQIFNVQDRLPWNCSIPAAPAVREASTPRPDVTCRRALVLGAGPIGLLCAMVLIDAGFETTVYSRTAGSRERVDLVEKIGGRFIIAEEVTPGELRNVLGRVDAVIEAVGASQLAFDTLGLLDANAIFVFTGVPGRRGPNNIDTDAIMRNLVLKNQALIGTVNAGPEHFRSAIAALKLFNEKWPGQLQRLKTGFFPPEQAPELLLAGTALGIKNVIAFEIASGVMPERTAPPAPTAAPAR